MSFLNVLAGVLCLAGLGLSVALFGPGEVLSRNALPFTASLAVAGLLFCLAATDWSVTVGARRVDLRDCSGLGDVAVGVAIFGGLASVPPAPVGVPYAALVVLGGTSAVLFGIVGLAEKYDRL